MSTLANYKLDRLTSSVPAGCGLTHSSSHFARMDIDNKAYCSCHSLAWLLLSLLVDLVAGNTQLSE